MTAHPCPPPVPYFGGKITAAPRIASLLPAHQHYVEPFAGSLAVLLAKPRAPMETVNDLDGALVTFWRVLRERPADLARVCALTPHSRGEYIAVLDALEAEPPADDLEVARRVFVQLTQGRAGVRRRSGWRHYVDPAASPTFSMGDYLDGYLRRILPAAERLAGVSLECRPALDLIRRYGRHPGVLLYVDPPYLGATRGAGDRTDRSGTRRYLHEMTGEDEHRELGEALRDCAAAVVVSGYASTLYDDMLAGWSRTEFPAFTGQGAHAAGVDRGQMNRTEVLWSNRAFPVADPDQGDLWAGILDGDFAGSAS